MDVEQKFGLKVQMLGGFSLSWNGHEISDDDNRSKKVWLLLAYMICCRGHHISQNELFSLLWGDDNTVNPANALKTMFHRVRTMLDGLGSNAGHTLILRREGTYTWNHTIPMMLDIDEFESLCQEAAAQSDSSMQLELYQKALSLYRGDFLSKLSSEPWVLPQSTYFHNLYLRALRAVLPLLQERNRQSEIVSICNHATLVEPYDETLYQFLMRAQLDLGDQEGTIKTYESMSKLLFSNFGILPADQSKALYREAVRTAKTHCLDLGILREQLSEEPVGVGGALLCDFDFFKIIYQAEARGVARNGTAVHIALISVSNDTKPLSRRSLDCCIENLKDVITTNLRKGDVVSQCSMSQYVLLLSQANYENSCMVCDRILKAFSRQYPHSPAVLTYTVQPLIPNT